jgi:NAD(P)-dependent dehydrogenase (short-subunit alcohol dehydrogenase family)
MRLEGKVGLITGSSRNIGKEIARRFVREGAAVVVNAATSADELQETADELRAEGGRVVPVLADVSKRTEVQDMVEQGIQELGKIDVLVLNHSIRPSKPLLEVTDEEWELVLGVNLHATMYLLQAVLPGMIERGSGSVISLGRPGEGGRGGVHGPKRAHSNASLAGKHALVRGAMYQFSPLGIRFNFVSPGLMNTVRKNPDWYPEAETLGKPQLDPEILAHVPMGRPGEPYEVADACVFLASDEASYVNGQLLGVDGGFEL